MLSVDTHCIMHTGVVFPSLLLSVQELILVFVYYNSNYYFLDLDSQIKMSTDILILGLVYMMNLLCRWFSRDGDLIFYACD